MAFHPTGDQRSHNGRYEQDLFVSLPKPNPFLAPVGKFPAWRPHPIQPPISPEPAKLFGLRKTIVCRSLGPILRHRLPRVVHVCLRRRRPGFFPNGSHKEGWRRPDDNNRVGLSLDSVSDPLGIQGGQGSGAFQHSGGPLLRQWERHLLL